MDYHTHPALRGNKRHSLVGAGFFKKVGHFLKKAAGSGFVQKLAGGAADAIAGPGAGDLVKSGLQAISGTSGSSGGGGGGSKNNQTTKPSPPPPVVPMPPAPAPAPSGGGGDDEAGFGVRRRKKAAAPKKKKAAPKHRYRARPF